MIQSRERWRIDTDFIHNPIRIRNLKFETIVELPDKLSKKQLDMLDALINNHNKTIDKYHKKVRELKHGINNTAISNRLS